MNEENETYRRIHHEREEFERKEKELAISKNFGALIEHYMKRWRNTAMYEIPTLYQKISFNYGMLKDLRGFEKFVAEECQMTIGMMASDKDLNIGVLLFRAGMNYPNLSEQDMDILDELSCNENYYELIESLYIAEEYIPRPIRKFDKTIINIRHTEFSKDFLDEVYHAFLKNNENYNWYDIKVYDRPSNSVIEVDSEDDVSKKTQFIVDFGLTLSDFLSVLEIHFEMDFIAEFVKEIDSDIGMMSSPDHWVAGESIFVQFEKLVIEKNDSQTSLCHLNFSRNLARNWLKKQNECP